MTNTQTITLKQIGVESASTLAMLWQQTFREAYSDVHRPEDIKQYCADNYTFLSAQRALQDTNTLCKIAIRSETALGFYLLKHNVCPPTTELNAIELKQLYLRSSEYGRGLAQHLLSDILDASRAKQYSALWLSVSDKNHRAKAFYIKSGFKWISKGSTIKVGTDTLTSSVLMLLL